MPLAKKIPIPQTQAKFIDDMTLGIALDLEKILIKNPDPNPILPLNFHNRTGHVLQRDTNLMQKELNALMLYVQEKQMKINVSKSNVMLFNPKKSIDFMPQLSLGNETNLDVVESTKLLGVMLRSDLKWKDNTEYICKRAYIRLYMLRRLKGLGASTAELFDVYRQQVVSVLELSVPVWSPALTQHEVAQIERVQKAALHIILGNEFITYDEALHRLELDTLSDRRYKICLKFAIKTSKSPKFNQWFTKHEPNQGIQTRSENQKSIFKPVYTRTKRYEKSTIPYLTNLLNNCDLS